MTRVVDTRVILKRASRLRPRRSGRSATCPRIERSACVR